MPVECQKALHLSACLSALVECLQALRHALNEGLGTLSCTQSIDDTRAILKLGAEVHTSIRVLARHVSRGQAQTLCEISRACSTLVSEGHAACVVMSAWSPLLSQGHAAASAMRMFLCEQGGGTCADGL